MRKMTILAVILALAIALSACGNEKAPETTAATTVATTAATVPAETTLPSEPLTLAGWAMTANTWSSPNGATINISASTNYYAEGQKADFVVRLEGEEIISVPCKWDEISYTASVDLNAANGYSYYVVLTAADGTATEVAVNTPDEPVNETLINLAASLESYCSVTLEESTFEDGKLTLTGGQVQVKAPSLTSEGVTISCQEAVLLLSLDGEELDQEVVALTQADTTDIFEATLDNIVFDIPEMESNQKVELTMNATLSNGQSLSAFGGNWSYSEDGLLPAFG